MLVCIVLTCMPYIQSIMSFTIFLHLADTKLKKEGINFFLPFLENFAYTLLLLLLLFRVSPPEGEIRTTVFYYTRTARNSLQNLRRNRLKF